MESALFVRLTTCSAISIIINKVIVPALLMKPIKTLNELKSFGIQSSVKSVLTQL